MHEIGIHKKEGTELNDCKARIEEIRSNLAAALCPNSSTVEAEQSKPDGSLASASLRGPIFAIDEFHVLQNRFIGSVFHSDYYEHIEKEGQTGKQQLMDWQAHERNEKHPHPDSKYKRCSSLMTAFRWIMDEMVRESESPQLSIMASTYFSVWEPLLDTETYSRSKVEIERFCDLPELNADDMFKFLKENINSDFIEREEKSTKELLQLWCGRPGLFFDVLLDATNREFGDFMNLSPIDELKRASERATGEFTERMKNKLDSMLNSRYRAGSNHGALKDNVDNVASHLLLVYRLRNGNMDALHEDINELVTAGIARVTSYDEKNRVHAVIKEKIVDRALQKIANDNKEKDPVDSFLRRKISVIFSNYGEYAELAVANRLLALSGQTLRELLHDWLCLTEEELGSLEKNWGILLQDFTPNMKGCGKLEDFNSSDADFVKRVSEGNVLFGKTGVRLPDLSFAAWTQDEKKVVFVWLQIKTYSDPLKKEEFINGINSTTPRFFLSGNTKRLEDNKKNLLHLQNLPVNAIFHLRLLLCSAGFTTLQKKMVEQHNKENIMEPISLVAPYKGMGNRIYGHCYNALKKKVGKPKKKQQQSNKAVPLFDFTLDGKTNTDDAPGDATNPHNQVRSDQKKRKGEQGKKGPLKGNNNQQEKVEKKKQSKKRK